MPNKVKVTLLDVRTGAILGETVMAASGLPESFQTATTLHIGDEEWSVQNAEPPLRSQFAATGKLVLSLGKIERLDPRTILFSLPTIHDRLPGEAEQADGTEVVLMEDHWRQVEFVHASHRATVEEELRDIRRIHEEHRKGVGFDKIHVRGRLPDALTIAKLETQVLHQLAPGPSRLLRFANSGARIMGGFARELAEGWLLYGVIAPPFVETLALQGNGAPLPAPQIAALEKLAHGHGLLLVDWCRCAIGEPMTAMFGGVISGQVIGG